MLPVNSQSDYTQLAKDAKLVCQWFKPVWQQCDTLSDKVFYSGEISIEGLMKNVVFMARVDVIDSNNLIVGGNANISIESCLKAVVEWVKVSMNDRDIINHSQMQQYFRTIDLFQKDRTEDEALAYFYDTPQDSVTSDKVIVVQENVDENISWNKWLMETKKDKFVFYEAGSHFIYKDSPVPLV